MSQTRVLGNDDEFVGEVGEKEVVGTMIDQRAMQASCCVQRTGGGSGSTGEEFKKYPWWEGLVYDWYKGGGQRWYAEIFGGRVHPPYKIIGTAWENS